MAGVILNSPQCGGTHALINLLRSFGMTLEGRHRDGVFYRKNVHPKTSDPRPIVKGFELPISDGQFVTGHSAPFPTDLLVISNRRDPRNIMMCLWQRRFNHISFFEWLTSKDGRNFVATMPRHWSWSGANVLKVWYEDLRREQTQRGIAAFCGVDWKATEFYGHGKTWSGRPSDWQTTFDAECVQIWDDLWREITGQPWVDWWSANGRTG